MENKLLSRFADILKSNLVTVLFSILCVLTIILSGQSIPFVITEVISRVGRNAILILSLLLPVFCGMGLNFSIVIGAMAGEIGLLLVTHWNVDGPLGLLVAAVIGTGFAIVFGFLTGLLFNKTKGQEMITGMILGFFSVGLFDFVFIFLIGGLIPFKDSRMVLDTGVGLRNTIEFNPATKQAIDKIWSVPFFQFLNWFFIIFLLALVALTVFRVAKNKVPLGKALKSISVQLFFLLVTGVVALVGMLSERIRFMFLFTRVPVAVGIVIALVCIFVVFITRTKLGQDIRIVGQSMAVATSAGINVDRIRIISVIFSTVIASWGQIVFLQNMGNINTFSSHEQVATYAIGALLVGGASISKATISQVFMGMVLFHILFAISPLAGKVLFNDPLIGEYFRVFVCYGVIAISLAIYAWQKIMEKKRELELIEQQH